MASSAAMTTLHSGHLAARVVVIVVTAAIALWLYAESGEPTLAILATGGLSVAAAAELLAGRHLLDLGIIGDEFVIVRRRVWQRRSRGREQRLPRSGIQGVAIVRSTRPGSRGPDKRYRLDLCMAAGEVHALFPQPYRSPDSAEAIANEVGRILGLEPEWRNESG